MKALVVFGVSRASRLTLDQGSDRKLADILHMGGHSEEAEAAGTVARYLAQWEKTGTLAMRRGRAIQASGVTRTEGHGYAIDHEREIRRSIKLVKVRGFSLVGTVGVLAFAHLVMARANREAADDFMRSLVSGADLKSGSPLFLARERLIAFRRAKPQEVFETIARGWNAQRDGKPISHIRITGGPIEIKG